MAQGKLSQKLLFILGKGGVGRSTVALSLGRLFASRGEKVLLVQWTLEDPISPLFGLPPCGPRETALEKNLFTMNFEIGRTLEEYFVNHLKMRLLHQLVIENGQVQKLIHAAPGVKELFFLGRLFWLVELAHSERGWAYDRILVDMPATGHGISLFHTAQTIANFGMSGLLAKECERVTRLLNNKETTGTIFVTLPEELPIIETKEFIPKVVADLGANPLFLMLNRSVSGDFTSSPKEIKEKGWFIETLNKLSSVEAKEEFSILLSDIEAKKQCETQLLAWAQEREIDLLPIPDMRYASSTDDPLQITQLISHYLTPFFNS